MQERKIMRMNFSQMEGIEIKVNILGDSCSTPWVTLYYWTDLLLNIIFEMCVGHITSHGRISRRIMLM